MLSRFLTTPNTLKLVFRVATNLICVIQKGDSLKKYPPTIINTVKMNQKIILNMPDNCGFVKNVGMLIAKVTSCGAPVWQRSGRG